MLTYAFKELKHNNYEYIEGEHFDNIYDLFAEILSKGISYLLKQGLHKQYILKEDTIATLKGKLNLSGTIKERINQRARLACEYDELTVNNIYNQILKTAIEILLSQPDVKKEKKSRTQKINVVFC